MIRIIETSFNIFRYVGGCGWRLIAVILLQEQGRIISSAEIKDAQNKQISMIFSLDFVWGKTHEVMNSLVCHDTIHNLFCVLINEI